MAGDTITLMDGTYDNEGHVGTYGAHNGGNADPVHITTSGTSGLPITLKAEHNRQAILDCATVSTSQVGCDEYISLDSGAAYWVFDGLVIERGQWAGLTTNLGASHITIKHSTFRNIGNLYQPNMPGICGICVGNYQTVLPASTATDWIIDGNIFTGIGRTGGYSTLHFDHGIYNTQVANQTIINNLFYDNAAGWGVQLKGTAGTVLIANNTFINDSSTSSSEGGQLSLDGDGSQAWYGSLIIENNIFYQPKNGVAIYGWMFNGTLSSGGSCTFDHNVVYGNPGGSGLSACAGTNTLTSNPQLINSSSPYDLQLQSGSPAIDNGVSLAGYFTDDYTGMVTRPQGAGFDIGAYEYGGGGSPSETISPSSVTFAQPVPVSQTGTEIQYVTISNASGATASLVISSAPIAGDFVAGGVGTCGPYPQTLTAGQSCTISLKLAPTASGTRAGTLTITDNATGTPHIVSLTGTTTTTDDYAFSVMPTDSNGVAGSARALSIHLTNQAAQPTVGVDFTSHDFGSVTVGVQTGGFAFTLTNTGTAVLAISSITSSGDFSASSNCPISPSTLGIGNSCTITATFLPTAVGVRSGTVTITDNAADSPQTISLSGTGSAPPPSGSSVGTGISAGRVIIQ